MSYTKLNLYQNVTRKAECIVRYELLTSPGPKPVVLRGLEMRWFTVADRDGKRSLRMRWVKVPQRKAAMPAL